jgi:hypothetical protein
VCGSLPSVLASAADIISATAHEATPVAKSG